MKWSCQIVPIHLSLSYGLVLDIVAMHFSLFEVFQICQHQGMHNGGHLQFLHL